MTKSVYVKALRPGYIVGYGDNTFRRRSDGRRGKLKTKTVRIEGTRRVGIKEYEMPEPGYGQALVKIHSCNICTTDWQLWTGARAGRAELPAAQGHEIAGEIAVLGPGVREELQVGDHVALGNEGCGECYYCRSDRSARCPNKIGKMTLNGQFGSFGMSQYLTVKASRLYKMNPDLPFEEAAYLEPLATAIHGNKRLRVKPGDDLLVIGAGNLGLVNAQVARIFGARVLVSEIRDERVKLACELGFDAVNPVRQDIVSLTKKWAGEKGMDAVILAVGNTQANEQAMQLIGMTGRVLFFSAGYPAPELKVDPNTIHYSEFELIGAMNASLEDFHLSAKFLNTGVVKVDRLISHRVSIDEAQHAFELAATPGNYRVALKMW